MTTRRKKRRKAKPDMRWAIGDVQSRWKSIYFVFPPGTSRLEARRGLAAPGRLVRLEVKYPKVPM
jgi:hypothetical protein